MVRPCETRNDDSRTGDGPTDSATGLGTAKAAPPQGGVESTQVLA
jgi:hypothetical protein